MLSTVISALRDPSTLRLDVRETSPKGNGRVNKGTAEIPRGLLTKFRNSSRSE